jgi:hypothetical protein
VFTQPQGREAALCLLSFAACAALAAPSGAMHYQCQPPGGGAERPAVQAWSEGTEVVIAPLEGRDWLPAYVFGGRDAPAAPTLRLRQTDDEATGFGWEGVSLWLRIAPGIELACEEPRVA